MSDTVRISYCPHCGNTGPHQLVHTQEYLERFWRGFSDPKEHRDEPFVEYVAVCQTCNQVLVYGGPEYVSFNEADLEWPTVGLHSSVPKRVRHIYNEASRIQQIAPNAFAVQIRRALEAVCIERGATKGNLVHNIQELAKRGEIPKTLAEASDLLRLIGNVGAHAGDRDVHPLQAHALDKFFKVIIEYLYVSPSMIQEFRAGMEKSKKEISEIPHPPASP